MSHPCTQHCLQIICPTKTTFLQQGGGAGLLILLAWGTDVRGIWPVMERILQLEEANETLRKEFSEERELGEERHRHDRDTVRHEAQGTARPVAPTARRSLTLRAHLGAVSGRMLELLRTAESPELSMDRVHLQPGDNVLDTDHAP